MIVGGAFLVLFIAYGTQYAFGVFFSALLKEFGWSRASLAGAFSLYTLVYSGCGFLTGRLTDRWGPRMVIAFGGTLLGAGLMGMSLVSALWHPFVLYGLVAALGMSTTYVPCSATVVRWFARRRGLAVGIASAGGSLGTFVLPPAAHGLVSALGWRGAYVAFGAGIVVALNLLARLMRRDPESSGLRPDGELVAPGPRPPEAAAGFSVREAMRTRSFWVIYALFSATWIPMFIPVVHLVPHALDLGIEPLRAATLVSATGIGAVLGRIGMGGLSDRTGRRAALAVGLGLQAACFMGFVGATALPVLYAVSFGFGFAYGSVSAIFPAIVADFFGRARSGALVGLMFTLGAPPVALGPVAAGWIYDHTGGYALAWWLAAAFNALALGLVALARPPRPVAERRAAVVISPTTS